MILRVGCVLILLLLDRWLVGLPKSCQDMGVKKMDYKNNVQNYVERFIDKIKS